MEPKTHLVLGIVAGFAAFFATGILLFTHLPPGNLKWILMTSLLPVTPWAVMAVLNRVVPARCPQCGAGAYRERGAQVRYACRSCKHVADLGFKVLPGRSDD